MSTTRSRPSPQRPSAAHPSGERLRSYFSAGARGSGPVSLGAYREGRRLAAEMKKIPQQLQEELESPNGTAMHPAAAIYFYVHNHVSVLTEALINAPELEKLAERLERVQDLYMPSFPPMSPITNSHFQCWAYYDTALGPARETFGTCILDLAAELKLQPSFTDVLAVLAASRLGLYVHQGHDGELMVLRELVTGKTVRCMNLSGYSGRAGQLWLTRVLPPSLPTGDFSINFTTPHVIKQPGEGQWLRYLDRTLPKMSGASSLERYQALMKYGLTDDQWNEYIFEAYESYDPGAVFLSGLPDIASSRPQSEESEDGGYRPLK